MTTGLPDPAAAHVRGALVTGTRAELIQVQATVSDGAPAFGVSGVPGISFREARDRVRAAVLNSGLVWPTGAITIRLPPASAFRHGCGLDLPIAVAVLAAAGILPASVGADRGCVFAAELGLDGQLRPVRSLVPILQAAAQTGRPITAVIAPGNWPEACMVARVTIAPCQSMRQVAAWLRGQHPAPEPYPAGPAPLLPEPGAAPVSLAALGIPATVRRVLEASAAGRHHLRLASPDSATVTALAAGLAALLPGLDDQQADEATVIHSAAGLLGSDRARITRPPLRIVGQSASVAAMIGGGGARLRPGEAALADHGVLCLPGAADFDRRVLDTLRQPLAKREIVITCGGATARFPARFILTAGLRRCPCTGPARCACTPLQARRYQGRLTSALGPWFPLRVTADPGTFTSTAAPVADQDADTVSAARVAEARDRMRHRLAATPWRLNGDIPHHELTRTWPPAADGRAIIEHAIAVGVLSDLAARQVTAVAWTLADLAGKPRPGAAECTQALAYREGTSR